MSKEQTNSKIRTSESPDVITVHSGDDIARLLGRKHRLQRSARIALGSRFADDPRATRWTDAINKGLRSCGCASGMVALVLAAITAWWISGELLGYSWLGRLGLSTLAGITGLLAGKFGELWYRNEQMQKALDEIQKAAE